MKTLAVAPANIAFIKYWGKTDVELRLPANTSISMNLSSTKTTTSVEFDESFKSDKFTLNGVEMSKEEPIRVSNHIDQIRNMAGVKMAAQNRK